MPGGNKRSYVRNGLFNYEWPFLPPGINELILLVGAWVLFEDAFSLWVSLNHFQPMFHFYTHLKAFSGDTEDEYWLKMG